MNLYNIIDDLKDESPQAIMHRCIEDKLNKSLVYYIGTLDKSCEEILDLECLRVVNMIANRYVGDN